MKVRASRTAAVTLLGGCVTVQAPYAMLGRWAITREARCLARTTKLKRSLKTSGVGEVVTP